MTNIYQFNSVGFYTRIDEYDTIREKVLNYVNVMARPMVMYQNDHPIHWTPPFTGGKVSIGTIEKFK